MDLMIKKGLNKGPEGIFLQLRKKVRPRLLISVAKEIGKSLIFLTFVLLVILLFPFSLLLFLLSFQFVFYCLKNILHKNYILNNNKKELFSCPFLVTSQKDELLPKNIRYLLIFWISPANHLDVLPQ